MWSVELGVVEEIHADFFDLCWRNKLPIRSNSIKTNPIRDLRLNS